MRKPLTALAIVLGTLNGSIFATEYKPWFGRELVPEAKVDVVTQLFRDVETKYGSQHYASTDFFVDLGMILAPTENTSFELEAILAETAKRTFGWDSIKFTGRYLWINGVLDDTISLSTGATLAKVFKPSRNDLAVFHHGGIEGELHAAIGRESVCGAFWSTRWWGVAGVGIGDLGFPWVRGDVHYGWNWWDHHQCELFIHTLWGLGHEDLESVHYFHGYGPIKHQSIDLGVNCTRILEYGIELKIEYSYRVYAKNCPEGANIVALRFTYPFNP